MNFRKENFSEATSDEIKRKGSAVLKGIQDEAKKEKKEKKDSEWYRKQLEANLAHKRERLEWQKERSKVKDKLRRKSEREKGDRDISGPIQSLKTQTISDKDTDPTAYKKAIETGYDTTVAVAKSAINALRKKREENRQKEEDKQKQLVKQRGKSEKESSRIIPDDRLKKEKKKKLLSPAKVKGLLPPTTTGRMARKSPEFKKSEIEKRGGTTTPPKSDFKSSEFDKRRSTTEEFSLWREEFLYELGDMRRKKRKNKNSDDYIVDVMTGKNNIIINPTIKEQNLEERKRDHLTNALLGLAFASNVVQSPESLIRSGHVESPGMQLMSRMMQRRKEANRNLDSARVSDPSRNIKKKNKIKEEIDSKLLLKLIVKKITDKKKRKNYLLNTGYIGESSAWQRKEGKNPEGGLNKKGIASYRRENPGSKLSLAVTTLPSKLKSGSKAANRRKSFCARMGGMPGPMKDEKGRPTRKALSLKKWNC
jgi:hypothetical protein